MSIVSLCCTLFTTHGNNVLKETEGWTIDSIAPGHIWYNYTNYCMFQNAFQVVNVIELDMNNPEYQVEVVYLNSQSIMSNVAAGRGAIAGTNGTYETDASFIKSNGTVNSQVTIPPGHLRYWKHEGAFFYDPAGNDNKIEYGTNDGYLASLYPNIISGSPMLIDNYNAVGETFIGDVSGINLNNLEYEDYRRHQGVRHPRTAIAKTEDNKILLITVDGRRSGFAEGMTAKELTQFVQRYFNPKSALNLDGGGSTAMWIANRGVHGNGIVNYPCDGLSAEELNAKRISQRSLRTFVLFKKVSSEQPLSEGDGSAGNPYIIRTAEDLQAIHQVDYAQTVYFRMENDVDMAGIDWIPLNAADPYAKHIHFDGNGHIIKNLSCRGYAYASLFGVLCGSCRNLGVIDAAIESTNPGGIIAGYVGIKTPTSALLTGEIDNCYTSGSVSGTDAVGGIAGNIGKPYTNNISAVRNCYSTASVTARNTSGNSRCGGIAGIVWDKGVVDNCYATGTILSSRYGAGGIAGWSNSNLTGCLSLNKEIKNLSTGNIGRISAFMGQVSGVIAQGDRCWGSKEVVLNNAGALLAEQDLNTGTITQKEMSYDGETQSKEFLESLFNYQDLGWDFTGDDNIWAQQTSNGFPVFQWLYDRADHEQIDGHPHSPSGICSPAKEKYEVRYYQTGRRIQVESPEAIQSFALYDSTGKCLHHAKTNEYRVLSPELEAGMYILSITANERAHTYKCVVGAK